MAPVDTNSQRRVFDRVASTLLMILHAALVLTGLLIARALLSTGYGCHPSTTDCRGDVPTWFAVAVYVVGSGTVLLFILDMVLAIRRIRKGRSAFLVPLLCCIGQAVLVGAALVR